MPGSAAGHEDHTARGQPAVDVVPDTREYDTAAVRIDAAADAVHDGARLLVDLLEHEGGISALLKV